MTAPEAGYGCEPAWIARVEKPRRCHCGGAPAPTPACSSGFGTCGSAGGFSAGGVDVTDDHGTPGAVTLTCSPSMTRPSPGRSAAPRAHQFLQPDRRGPPDGADRH